jgi:LmbE family N-acetylglucosaminyl deacetylase
MMPRRRSFALLTGLGLALVPALPLHGQAPGAVRLTPQKVACEEHRAEALLARMRVEAPNALAAELRGLLLTFTAGGAPAGIAWVGGAGRPESLLAFSTDPAAPSLLRDPARLQLARLGLSRDPLSSDLVAARDPGLLRITLDPTVAGNLPPASRPGLDNLADGRAAEAAAGRGLDGLLDPCHGDLSERDAWLLSLLARLARPGAAGGSFEIAVFRDAGPDELRLDLHPLGSDGRPRGRLAARLAVAFSPDGALATGTLRLLPRCTPGQEAGCTTLQEAASLVLARPAAPGRLAADSPYRVATGPGGSAEAAVDFAELLAGSAWRRPPRRSVSLAERLAAGPLLWVAAHPDDDVLAAPLLGDVCSLRGGRCTLLVATRGERGVCRLAGGCSPDVGTVREAEMRAAAKVVGATLVQWDLPDGAAGSPSGVVQAWESAAGGAASLRERIRAVVEAAAPAAVLTFDPRHGSTCHADHRAVALLVEEVIVALPALPAHPEDTAPELYFLETTVGPQAAAGIYHFAPAVPGDPALQLLDASRSWPFLLDDAAAQPSQFDPPRLAALAAVPARERQVPVLPAGAVTPGDPRYTALCSPP